MATTTDNYELILPTGEDRVNPLTQVNPNFETIDAQMKANANAGVGVANEIKTGTVHALTRITNNGDCAVFRFLATSDYNIGDSFTVDGVSVTALLPSGEALGSGAYVIGSTVLCVLVETRLTVYTTGGTASDSNALDGHPASYFLDASNEVFDNTNTDLTATNTEGAIKQIDGKLRFKLFDYTYDAATIAPGGETTFNPTNSVPSGWTPIAISVVTPNTSACVCRSMAVSGNTIIHNISANTVTTYPTIKVLLTKNVVE